MRQMLNLPQDIKNYLQSKDNMSKYVSRLIRQDMTMSYEEKIKTTIREEIINRKLAEAAEKESKINKELTYLTELLNSYN